MPHYKDSQNNLHFIEKESEHYLPSDCVEITDSEADAIRQAAIPVPTQEEIQRTLLVKLDEHIDNTAKAKGYDSHITCALRAGYVNPWQQEGIAFGQWMDSCYVKAYQIQVAILANLRPIPTAEELLAEMPVMVWPI